MTVCIAVLSFFVGMKVGQAEKPVAEDTAPVAYLPDPADGDALEALLNEVERARNTAGQSPDLSFPEELRTEEAALPPQEALPSSMKTAVGPGLSEPPAPPSGAADADAPSEGWAVQVAALESETEADALIARLAANGHAAYRVEALVRGSTWYRVRVGGFKTKEAAAEGQGALASELGRSDLMVARAP